MKSAWLGLGLAALALSAGCDDGFSLCLRDDAGLCRFFPTVVDAAAPSPADAGPTDAAADSSADDAALVDAAADAEVDAYVAPETPLTAGDVESFCAAQFRSATAWRNKLDQCCATAATAEQERSDFLLHALAYQDGFDGTESVAGCVAVLNNVKANIRYSPADAARCADVYTAQFTTSPPAACPAGGFAIETLESTIGHRALAAAQLAECRAAFQGKLRLNDPCNHSFECAGDQRCLGSMNSKNCGPARSLSDPCTASSECAAGLVCQGSDVAGRSCQRQNAPVNATGNCTLSSECDNGYYCPAGKCVLAPQTLYCAP